MGDDTSGDIAQFGVRLTTTLTVEEDGNYRFGSRKFDAVDLAANPHLRPITIKAGALGNMTPSTDQSVSRQHRALVRSAIAERMFGTQEILIAANQLVALGGIDTAKDAQPLLASV